jgi:hypothetical protein
MPAVRIIETTAAQWGVFVQMRRVLCASGAVSTSRQEASGRDAGSDSQISRKSWPGRGVGVRGPIADETPLSRAEVHHGLTRCLL